MDIGSRLFQLLKEKKMNQITLANLLGKPPVYVHNIIKKKTLDTGKLKEVADALKVSITYFFEEDYKSKEDKGYCVCNENENQDNFFCPFRNRMPIGMAEHVKLMEKVNRQIELLEEISSKIVSKDIGTKGK